MKSLAAILATVALTAGCVAQAAPPQSAGAPRLTIEQLIDIRHPSNPMWAPDGRHVVFVWDRAGVSKVYVADVSSNSAPSAPRELPDAGAQLGGAFWSADGLALLVSKNGDLWRVPIDGSGAAAVWTTPQPETGITRSPDASRVAFVRGRSELFVRSLVDGRETLVVRAADKTIGGVGWSPDGQSLVFTSGAQPIRHEQTPPYSGSKIIYAITENVPGQTFVVPAAGGSPRPLSAGTGFGGRRWIDTRRFVVDRTSDDFKRRTTSLVDIGGGEPKVIHEDVEDKFWSMTGDAGGNAQPSPDGKWIAFLSDADGWDHLYVMPADGARSLQPSDR